MLFEVNGILERVMPKRKIKNGKGKVQDIIVRMTTPDKIHNSPGRNRLLLQVFNDYISSTTLSKLEGERVKVKFFMDCKVKELPDGGVRWWNNAIANKVEVR